MRVILLLVALWLAPHSAQSQTNPEPAAADASAQQQVESEPVYQQLHDIPPQLRMPQQPPPQPGTEQSTTSERWRYDPAARPGVAERRPHQESVIERGLKGINPSNVPYGRLLDEWRAMLVQETIENIYFWMVLILCFSLMISCSYHVWFLQQREERLQIAGAIVAQLWNAHVFARRKALEAIEAHNKLVAKVNAEYRAAREQSTSATTISSDGLEGYDSAEPNLPELPHGIPSGEMSQVLSGVFAPPPKDSPDQCSRHDDGKNENDPVPLQVRAAQFAQSQPQQPPAKVTRPDAAEETPKPSSESGNDAEASAAENVEALKQALQKAQAQLATQDAQLRAKDDKITSQRQLISDLNNRSGANGGAGSGAR
jgi:hypothetical protein